MIRSSPMAVKVRPREIRAAVQRVCSVCFFIRILLSGYALPGTQEERTLSPLPGNNHSMSYSRRDQSKIEPTSIFSMDSEVRILSWFAPQHWMVVAIRVSFNSGSQMLTMLAQDSMIAVKRPAFSIKREMCSSVSHRENSARGSPFNSFHSVLENP